MSDQTCQIAAQNGYFDILKWARQVGCPWNYLICQEAARRGHLEILQWARLQGCEWNLYTQAIVKIQWPNLY